MFFTASASMGLLELFSFAIVSYIDETDFTLGLSQKISLLSPLIIGSKLSFSG